MIYWCRPCLSENRFFGYDSETKKYDAEAHRDRIFGKHVADYMRLLKETDEEAYKRQFSHYIANGIEADSMEEVRMMSSSHVKSVVIIECLRCTRKPMKPFVKIRNTRRNRRRQWRRKGNTNPQHLLDSTLRLLFCQLSPQQDHLGREEEAYRREEGAPASAEAATSCSALVKFYCCWHTVINLLIVIVCRTLIENKENLLSSAQYNWLRFVQSKE